MSTFQKVIKHPIKYLRAYWSKPRVEDDSPLEISTNDDHDSMFDEMFCDAHNLWGVLDRGIRRDAEEKAYKEFQNSGHSIGAVKRIANDVMGSTGPTVQIIPNADFDFDEKEIEEYQEVLHTWLEDMDFHRKLKTMLKVLPVRGEAVGHFHRVTGERETQIFDSPLKMNFKVKDARRLDTETLREAEARLLHQESTYQEGIKEDRYGEPDEYRFDTRNIGHIKHESFAEQDEVNLSPKRPAFDRIPQEWVVHLFHEDVPEQRRGFTQFAASTLPSSLARRASMSITKGLRKLAMMFGFIEQPALPEGATFEDEEGNQTEACEMERAKPGSGFKIRDGIIKFLGGGMKFNSPAQNLPSNGSESFLDKMIGWIGSPICQPLFWITGDFSKTNFTSGRMGMQGADGYRDDLRDLIRSRAYKRAIKIFHKRAPNVPGLFSESLLQKISAANFSDGEKVIHPKHPKFKLHWPSRPAISPLVEARGKQIELMMGTKSHAELSEDADVLTRWKCEAELYGITLAQYRRLMLHANLQMDAETLNNLLQQDAADMEESDTENVGV